MENQFSGLVLNINNQEVWTKLIGSFNAYNLLVVYAVSILLEQDPIETLISDMSGQASMFLTKRSLTAEQFKLYTDFEKIMHYRGVQARMSFNVNVQ